MRLKWPIAMLVFLLPLGALAVIGAGIDVPNWLSDRMDALRSAVAPGSRPDSPNDIKQTKSMPQVSDARRSADPPVRQPSIDVARLDPQGSSVIAGLARPGEAVTVLADGKPFAVVTADANGEWVVITSHKFDSDDPTLEVRPGAMKLPRTVTAAASPATASERPDVKMQRTAATVTRRMMRNLERLADDAEATVIKPERPVVGAQSAVAGQTLSPASDSAADGFGSAGTPSTTSASRTDAGAARVASRALSTASQEDRATSTASVPATLPVPVQFVYREPVFTPEGEKAAELLLRYFKLKGFKKVALSGHADERGSHEANMELSKARLDHLARYLRDGGFEGELELVPKGENEKFTGVDRSEYPVEELWQLDRRVEVMSVE